MGHVRLLAADFCNKCRSCFSTLASTGRAGRLAAILSSIPFPLIAKSPFGWYGVCAYLVFCSWWIAGIIHAGLVSIPLVDAIEKYPRFPKWPQILASCISPVAGILILTLMQAAFEPVEPDANSAMQFAEWAGYFSELAISGAFAAAVLPTAVCRNNASGRLARWLTIITGAAGALLFPRSSSLIEFLLSPDAVRTFLKDFGTEREWLVILLPYVCWQACTATTLSLAITDRKL